MIWNTNELKEKEKKNVAKKYYRVCWSEVRTDVKSGSFIVEAEDEKEAEGNFWNDQVVIEEPTTIDEGEWEDQQIDRIEEVSESEVKSLLDKQS